jgi:hypothetical protein
MACAYAIEAYGPDAEALPRILDEAFDEVDRIDRLMVTTRATAHYRALIARPRSMPLPSIQSCSTSSRRRCDTIATLAAHSTSPSAP